MKNVNIELTNILSNVIHQYVSSISNSNNIRGMYRSTKTIEKKRVQHYGFIPSDTLDTLKILYKLYCRMRKEGEARYKFLDIGCGIGNIVLLARKVGFDAYGLEYNKKIYNVAKDIVPARWSSESDGLVDHILRGNMMDFKEYGKYDVLYFYIPIANDKAMRKFAKKLMKAVKLGAYIIPIGFAHPFQQSKEFKVITVIRDRWSGCAVYRKIKTQ